MEPSATFRESQRFRQVWLWLLLGGILLAVLVLFGGMLNEQLVHGRPVGRRPMADGALVGVAIGAIGLPALLVVLLAAARLEVEVRADGLHVRFFPFLRARTYRYDDLAAFAARSYRPIAEYGGWGVRGLGRNRAFNVSGNEGVQLAFRDGKRLLLGSQRAAELENAIAVATRRKPGGV
jgi:hypothetical protein